MATTLKPPLTERDEYAARPATRSQRARIEVEVPDHDLTLAYWLSGALATVALVTSVVSLLVPSLFHDPAMTAGNVRGTTLVILVAVLPVMVTSMVLTARGSVRAQVVWAGMLGYILYYAAMFCFDVSFNRLYPLYVAMLSLSLWSTVALVRNVHIDRLRIEVPQSRLVRAIAVYLLLPIVLFGLAELRDIVPAIVNDTSPASLDGSKMLTNPFLVMNESVLYPLTILSAIWLWQGRVRGHFLAGVFLVFWTVEAASIAVDQVFGHISDPTQSTVMVPAMAALALIGLIPAVLHLRNLREPAASDTSEGSPQ